MTVAAALVGHSSHKPSYVTYTVLALTPIAIRFLSEGLQDYTIFGMGCFFTIVMLLRIANRNNKASVEALEVGIKYHDQAITLNEEKTKTEALNQQLIKQAQALQESEARFRGLSRATFEGIAIHERGQILDANDVALEMFGYEQSEIYDLTIHDLITPEFYEIATQHIQNGYEEPYEIQGVCKDGSIFPMEVQAKTVSDNDELVRVVAVRDITVRKQLEQEAFEMKLDHERVILLKTFFQNASHEFRTPLSIINTATYLIKQANTQDKRQQKLDEINEQTKRINTLVDNLSYMVKLDTDIQVEPDLVDVNQTLEAIVSSMRDAFENHQLNLKFELDKQMPKIALDRALVHRAVKEILENAIRHSGEGDCITIRTSRHQDHLNVEITDDGIGIDPEALSRIFERFYRVDESHTTAGFGVGLSIAKKIIELHHGEISVQSQLGQGSTFYIRLPLLEIERTATISTV